MEWYIEKVFCRFEEKVGEKGEALWEILKQQKK